MTMRWLGVTSALLMAAQAVCAAEIEPVVTPGVFRAPPAYPRVDRDGVVVPDVFHAPPAFPHRQIYDWTGAYVGIYAGGAFGRVAWTSIPDLTSGRTDASGALVGGTIGYNLQTGEPFVLGVEADVAWSSLSGTVPALSCGPNCEFSQQWFATTRLRAGYALDGMLAYVAGGFAMGGHVANAVGSPFGRDTVNNLGWTAGFGVEFVILGPWRAKLEYLYVDLNGFSCNLVCGPGPISFNLTESVIRAGLNYRIWDR